MAFIQRVNARSGILYMLYLIAVLGSYFTVMQVWRANNVFVENKITFEVYLQAIVTFTVGTLAIPWLIVSFQALVVWGVGLASGRDLGYRAIWRTAFWTYVVPAAVRGVASNLILLLAGRPTSISFGLGLLFPVPLWLDRATDLFFIAQIVLFKTYFDPNSQLEPKHRWLLTGGLAVASVVSLVLV